MSDQNLVLTLLFKVFLLVVTTNFWSINDLTVAILLIDYRV